MSPSRSINGRKPVQPEVETLIQVIARIVARAIVERPQAAPQPVEVEQVELRKAA